MGVRVPRAPKLEDVPDLSEGIKRVRELAAGAAPHRASRAVMPVAFALAGVGVVMALFAAVVAFDPSSPLAQALLSVLVSEGE